MHARALVFVSAALGLALSACAHGAEERQLAELRREIARVQAERDELDLKLSALEAGGGSASSRTGAKAPAGTAAPSKGAPPGAPAEPSNAAASRPIPPNLRVVRLTPESPSAPPSDAPTDRPPAPPKASDARRVYSTAMALLRDGRYEDALTAFAEFLVRWPDHPLAQEATYARGECYLALGRWEQAADHFQGALSRPGKRAPDALLKLGMARQKAGDHEAARAAFERLQREYPESDAAQRIPDEDAP